MCVKTRKEWKNEKIKEYKNITSNGEYFYQDLFTAFERDNNIDLFLVSIDYSEFLDMVDKYKYK